jgi:hypothetical protein
MTTRGRGIRWDRPKTAAAVARRSVDLESFGRGLRDWLHEIAQVRNRAELRLRWSRRPPPLTRLPDADARVAAAFLAAQVEHLCRLARMVPPRWVFDPRFVLAEPWFSLTDPRVRADLLVLSPAPFKNRNLFTEPEGVVRLSPGRPALGLARRRERARLRQRRWRARIRAGAARS